MISEYMQKYVNESVSSINLIASENYLPIDARRPFMEDCIMRYTFNPEGTDMYFPGRDVLTDLESRCCNSIGTLLKAKYVSIKPISGLNCMLAVIGGLTKIGDVIYSVSTDNGGHGATKPMIIRLGLEHRYLPYCIEKNDFDYNKMSDQLQDGKKVKMVYLDMMNIRFPIDVEKLKKLFGKRTLIVYDASHVMGLIMGRQFPNPLDSGADFLIGSTHKTLPGPHKGIVATNHLILYKLYKQQETLFISHHHTADVISLGIVIEKFMTVGIKYAEQVVKNATLLAKELSEGTMPIISDYRGYTKTHQIWIDIRDKVEALNLIYKMAEYGVIYNVIQLPRTTLGLGIRIGVQEITALGYVEKDVELLAEIILDIALDRASMQRIKSKKEQLISGIGKSLFD